MAQKSVHFSVTALQILVMFGNVLTPVPFFMCAVYLIFMVLDNAPTLATVHILHSDCILLPTFFGYVSSKVLGVVTSASSQMATTHLVARERKSLRQD